MFAADIYIQRRKILKLKLKTGAVLLPGNRESPVNYPANCYDFRQDSTFLYYFGIDFPGVAGIIDIDAGTEILFSDDAEESDIIWTGPQRPFAEKAALAGVFTAAPYARLDATVRALVKKGRRLHWLPQHRHDNLFELMRMTGKNETEVRRGVSKDLIRAVAAQRSVKTNDEVAQIEAALDISSGMYALAFRLAKPGVYEYEVYGAIEGLRAAKGSGSAFSSIITVRGEVLHGSARRNRMAAGDLLLVDSGAESPEHYASDVTRTIPVSGAFTQLQRDIYGVVLAANMTGIAAMKPDVLFRDVHLEAASVIADGMKRLGFMKGSAEDAVAAGAHALFFPHGLGHLLGLDVHDMEGLGENLVGYGAKLTRSRQFGLSHLRFARKLEPGMVLTVEPGVYFIPSLVAAWKSKKKFADFINYDAVEKVLGFGGIRIEDDVLVTTEGSRVLGNPVPKTIEEVEAACRI
jgi:Xaa-Pro dipeptidase